VHAVRRTGQPGPSFNYELFNCNNFNIRYWSWNYRGCWPARPPLNLPAAPRVAGATRSGPAFAGSGTSLKRAGGGGGPTPSQPRPRLSVLYTGAPGIAPGPLRSGSALGPRGPLASPDPGRVAGNPPATSAGARLAALEGPLSLAPAGGSAHTTRLALQLFLVKGFKLYSFQLQDPKEPCISIYCHYLPVSGLGNLRACCLPWMW
jgi:hypothetical protein